MKPLEGLRILDFTQFMAGPMCTLLLSDFGAEVIKIENPPLGDNTRYGKVVENNCSSHYATRNRGKKSILLNMKDEKHRALFLELVKTADAVVENFKPGTMEKFGITYDLLKELNPRIVYTRISGYGQDGPYASHAAFDATIQAEAGIMSITGPEGSAGVKCGASIGDYSGGMLGCIATLIGLLDAQRSGQGRCIDVSMMDSLLFLQENQLSVFLRTGVIPKPNGNRYPSASPIGDFMCKDGVPIMLNISTDAQWKTFAEVLGQPQWIDDPDFASMSLRATNYRKVEAEVSRVFAERDSTELADLLQSKQCVYGKINDYAAIASHPQVLHRKTFVNAVYPDGTSFRVPGNPLAVSGMERQMDYPTAPLGADTIAILSEVADEKTVHELMDPILDQAAERIGAMYQKM